MADHLSPWTKTFTRDTSKDIYEEVSYDTTKPKFDVVTIENDITINSVKANGQCDVYYKQSENNLTIYYKSANSSGTTPPAGDGTFYDTNNNTIKRYNSGSAVNQLSLPLATITDGTSTITSIDQVFNGFGYIGSTIFALPGVKGLIPNGRNEDGSLKNIEFTLNKVVLGTYADTLTTSGEPMLVGDNQGNITRIDYKNAYGKDYWHHEEAENKWYFAKNQKNWAEIGSAKWSSGVITSFTPKTAFHAVDRNDSSWLSGLGMPSNKNINLTLGASGSSYTAPANGYFVVVLNCGGKWANITTSTGLYNAYGNNTYANANFPVKKGDEIIITYESGVTKNIFKFVYAEGDK